MMSILLFAAATLLLDSCSGLSLPPPPTEGEATLGQFPYHVSIGVEYQLGNGTRTIDHHCGGSILSKKWILTAAHCFTLAGTDDDETQFKINPDNFSKITVRAGLIDHQEPGNQSQTFEIPIGVASPNLVVHEKWAMESESFDFDFALIKLPESQEFKFVENQVGPIQLVKEGEEPKEGDRGVVAGWGATSNGSYIHDFLQWLEVPILPDQDCEDSYNWENEDEPDQEEKSAWNPEVQICAGAFTGTDDGTNQGDSGSGLAFTIGGKTKLVGTVSFGGQIEFGEETPAVYGKVSSVLGWIKEKTGIDTD